MIVLKYNNKPQNIKSMKQKVMYALLMVLGVSVAVCSSITHVHSQNILSLEESPREKKLSHHIRLDEPYGLEDMPYVLQYDGEQVIDRVQKTNLLLADISNVGRIVYDTDSHAYEMFKEKSFNDGLSAVVDRVVIDIPFVCIDTMVFDLDSAVYAYLNEMNEESVSCKTHNNSIAFAVTILLDNILRETWINPRDETVTGYVTIDMELMFGPASFPETFDPAIMQATTQAFRERSNKKD